MKLDSMKLEVYSESMSKAIIDGKEVIFYGGEDTLPYVDDHVLFVADGIGGCSSTRHRQFNRDLFDPDKQFDTLFGKALDEPADDFTRDYLKRCFRDFVGNEPYFDKQMAARRKSAFYGARILSTLLLHKLRSDTSLGIYDGKIFEELHQSKYNTVKKKEAYLQTIADELGTYLHEKLMEVAKDAGFAKDKSSSSAIVMFGTTLCFTIYQESPDKKYVEALYFVAGDSRPYAMADFGPYKGMYQAVSDCEEADGSMTSCICAEERVPIEFLCAYRKFKTPCILFNASDGCFDTVGFISQITYEHTIYDTILKSQSLKDVGTALSDFFREYGRHDDCNTMAMRFFGFEPAETSGQESEEDQEKQFYANLQAWAKERKAKLEEEYLSKQEGLLDHDYAAELKEFLKPQNYVNCVKALVPLALEDGKLMAYVRSRLSDKKSQEYDQAFVNAVKKEAAESRKMGELDADIRLLLKDNLFSLPAPSDSVDVWQRAEDLKAEIHEKRDYLQKLAKTTLEKLKPLCKAFKAVSDCDPDKYTVKDTSAQVKYQDLLDQLQISHDEQQGSKRIKQDILSACEIKLQKSINELNELIRVYGKLEKTEAGKEKTHKSFLDKQIADLLDGSLTVESLKLASDDAKKLEKLRADYESARSEQITAQSEIDSIVAAYMEKNMLNMAIAVFRNELQVGKPLKNAITNLLEPFKAEKTRLEKAAKKQASILAEYDEVYYYVINHYYVISSNQKNKPSEQAEAAATSDDTASGS